jgi:hypothetical protein
MMSKSNLLRGISRHIVVVVIHDRGGVLRLVVVLSRLSLEIRVTSRWWISSFSGVT